jgi:hypothetical protein
MHGVPGIPEFHAARYGAGNLTYAAGEAFGGLDLVALFAKSIIKKVGGAILGGLFTIDGVVYAGCTIYNIVLMYQSAVRATALYCK